MGDEFGFAMFCLLVFIGAICIVVYAISTIDDRPRVDVRCPLHSTPFKDPQAHATIVSCLKPGEAAPVFKFVGKKSR